MSGLVNVEERETMVGELENLTKEWKERKKGENGRRTL